ncbi:uncharacterized protein [Lolium perenne]|uniref:uncharacterized protein n=1 Tax=Lolium perenne TaxID=4522 RepID=UPI0021F55F2D|nr:uncharacterized protein LOC127336332 [Lolium perenne]XP_051219099.1 uncharacterized protein LOC127336332 [Lolium perenne]
MEGKPLHLLLPNPRRSFPGLLPNNPDHHLPASRLRFCLRHRKPKAKQLAFSRQPPSPRDSQLGTPGRGGWDLARSASAAALALHLAVCSLLILSPTSARACVHPPPPAAAAVEAKEEEDDDEEWEAALQQWKSKTYALSVPLRVVALRGSFPPTWIKDFVEVQGKRLKFSPEFRPSIDALFSELSQCVDKGQVQPKSAMAADVVSIGDSWLGYAIRKGLVEPIKNAEEQDWYKSLSDRWKVHLCRNQNGEADSNGSVWGVPYRWGTVVIAYKKNKFKQHNLKPIQDWEDLWRPELAGKISMIDSPREVIGAVLKQLGSSYNTIDMETEVSGGREAVLNSFTQLQKQVQLFDSMNYLKSFGVGDVWVTVGWSSDVIPAAKRMSNVAIVVPKSGSSLWADLWAIPCATGFQTDRIGGRTRGPSPLIHQWFDFCLQSARSLPFRQEIIPGASPLFLENPAPEVPQDINKKKPKLESNLVRGVPPPEILEKCEFLEPLSDKALGDYQWLMSRVQRPRGGLLGNVLQKISSVLGVKLRF